MNRVLRAVAAAVVALGTLQANAAPINLPVASNAYITEFGLDWAWANPLPGGVDLSFQSQFGWRLPTLEELMNAPLATDFMFVGANVPLAGTDPVSNALFAYTNANLTGAAACATPYFSTRFAQCDWQDGNGQTYGPWAGTPGAQSFADQLVVRSAQNVPEPASLALVGLALLGCATAGARRRG